MWRGWSEQNVIPHSAIVLALREECWTCVRERKSCTSFCFCHVRRGVVRVFGALPNGPDRPLLGVLRHPAELESLDHPWA